MSHPIGDCLYCIDGNMPAGIHDILGEVYRPCPECLYPCIVCDGDGLYPSDFTCVGCLTAQLAGIGLNPILCPRCSGVVDLAPRHASTEVTCHAHHS
jgi:hypothetical protein